VSNSWIFDQSHYEVLNAAREATVRHVLGGVKEKLGLKTALDLGCGLGHYADLLHKTGFDVVAVDGREENILEARRRYPQLRFEVLDAQDSNLVKLGSFDFVFCFGLLYHLEDPFRVVRSIGEMAKVFTMVEGIVYPSPEPAMMLMDERGLADQGLNYMAFYPSETCLVKMLRRSGFSECYWPAEMPDHQEYREGKNGFRRRTVLAAAKSPVTTNVLRPWPDPSPQMDPWEMLPLYAAHNRVAGTYKKMDKILHKRRRG
jgi:SAM-dependent methyltransferase